MLRKWILPALLSLMIGTLSVAAQSTPEKEKSTAPKAADSAAAKPGSLEGRLEHLPDLVRIGCGVVDRPLLGRQAEVAQLVIDLMEEAAHALRFPRVCRTLLGRGRGWWRLTRD